MSELFSSGRLVDLILALVLIELIALTAFRRATGHGVPFKLLVANLAAGVALLLALRAALLHDRWQIIAGWLLAALVSHCVDLTFRWAAR